MHYSCSKQSIHLSTIKQITIALLRPRGLSKSSTRRLYELITKLIRFAPFTRRTLFVGRGEQCVKYMKVIYVCVCFLPTFVTLYFIVRDAGDNFAVALCRVCRIPTPHCQYCIFFYMYVYIYDFSCVVDLSDFDFEIGFDRKIVTEC